MKNFLIIQVDQVPARALKLYGGFCEAKNISKLAENGVVFDDCTCQFPLCQPSRASLWSGRYPHKTEVLSNGRNYPNETVSKEYETLGEILLNNGYRTIHFGKRHDMGALRGFENIEEKENENITELDNFYYNKDTFRDLYTVEKSIDFIDNYSENKPLCMVVDLINPHNICGWVGNYKRIKTPNNHFELPKNFDFPDIYNRAKSIQYICCSHNRQAQCSSWDKDDYKEYLRAYDHYLTLVDNQIGDIIESLENNKFLEDTTVVFFSDHGDSLAARNCVTKQVAMYEELVKVPLIFFGKNIKKIDKKVKGLAGNIDIAPTILDMADIKIPDYFDGISLKKSIQTGEKPIREFICSQWHTEWGFTISPARMIKTENYKYIHYLEDSFEELYDLKNDIYEQINIANDCNYKKILVEMRKLFKLYLIKEKDNYLSLTYKVDNKWRSHKIGYHNHKGIAAPQE